jgi:hypothetical protein
MRTELAEGHRLVAALATDAESHVYTTALKPGFNEELLRIIDSVGSQNP